MTFYVDIIYIINVNKREKETLNMIIELPLTAAPYTARNTFKKQRTEYTKEMHHDVQQTA